MIISLKGIDAIISYMIFWSLDINVYKFVELYTYGNILNLNLHAWDLITIVFIKG